MTVIPGVAICMAEDFFCCDPSEQMRGHQARQLGDKRNRRCSPVPHGLLGRRHQSTQNFVNRDTVIDSIHTTIEALLSRTIYPQRSDEQGGG